MNYLRTLISIIFLSLLLNSCGESNDVEIPPKDLLVYAIHNEDIYDTKLKTQISLDVVVENKDLQKNKVEELLNYLYKQTLKRTGFQHHKNPNSIHIFVYSSKEKASAKMAQWFAKLSKNVVDIEPKVEFNKIQWNSLSEKEEIRWNLTYEQRRSLWTKIILAQDRAQAEANNTKVQKELNRKYEQEVIDEFKIDVTIIDSIQIEGLRNGWPFP